MKLIKYDDRGRVMSSEKTHVPGLENKEQEPEGLNLVQPQTRKSTIRGLIVGVALAIPFAALVEFIRLLAAMPWDDFFWGILSFTVVVLASTAVGYLRGSSMDRES